MKSINLKILTYESRQNKVQYGIYIDGKCTEGITNRNKILSLIEQAMKEKFK